MFAKEGEHWKNSSRIYLTLSSLLHYILSLCLMIALVLNL